jgi:hypothetical protein
MKLIANTPIRHGVKGEVQEIAVGESFDVADKKEGERLIADGSASAPSRTGKSDVEKAEEKRLADEKAIAEANAKAEAEAEAARKATSGQA